MPTETTATTTRDIKPFAAKGETLPDYIPTPPTREGFEVHERDPMYAKGRWYWTAYEGNLGYELACSRDGKVLNLIRVPQIDCEDDDQ